MTTTAEQVLEAAEALSEGDRALLVDALLATLSSPEELISDEAWLNDIRRRSREINEGRVTPIPWSEVEARARIDGFKIMPEVTVHPEASQEYEDAVAWYHDRSPKAAERFRQAIRRRLDEIAQAPERWPRLDEEHHFALVERFPYFIVDVPRVDGVLVVALSHSRRRPDYWKGRH